MDDFFRARLFRYSCRGDVQHLHVDADIAVFDFLSSRPETLVSVDVSTPETHTYANGAHVCYCRARVVKGGVCSFIMRLGLYVCVCVCVYLNHEKVYANNRVRSEYVW